jgi:hypothetical protein
MSAIVEVASAITEPVDLATAKKFLRLSDLPGPDDDLINQVVIPGARRQLETALGLTLANRKFIQYEDGFPFFPYFQSPYAPLFGAAFPFYFGYGPIASYPYPAIGGLQNQMVSPFEKRLMRSPVTAISRMTYIGTDGQSHGLEVGKDFVADFASLPGRITPLPGQRWPVGMISQNTVAIYYSAGYLPPGALDEDILTGAIWQALQPVVANSYVIDKNSDIEVQIATGATTGKSEPTWPSVNNTVSDGTAVWKNNGQIVGRWAAGTSYTQPTIIQDSNGKLQQLVVASLTSGGTEPTWSPTRGVVTSDNSQAAWMNIGADESQGAIDPPNQITEYTANVAIPPNIYIGLLQLITHWYQQRSVLVTAAGAGGAHIPLPMQLIEIIQSERVWDFGLGR